MVKEQERLYAALRKQHPKWSDQRCSGFVHGVADEQIRQEPNPSYYTEADDYAKGYMRGFTVARGDEPLESR